MPRGPARADLLDGRPVFLLDLKWDGEVYRVSSEPVTITKDDGTVLSYSGEMTPPDSLLESMSRLQSTTEGNSASLEAILPVDIAARWRRGHDLSSATGDLWMGIYRAGAIVQTYEGLFPLVSGRVVGPQFGAPDRPLGWFAFTLEERPFDDVRRLIRPGATIRGATWSDTDSQTVDNYGKVYPLVIGKPGRYTEGGTSTNVPAVPAYCVDYDSVGIPNGIDTLIAAGHDCPTGSVVVFDVDGTSATINLTATTDSEGAQVTTLDISGESSDFRNSTEHWVAWATGGIRNPYGTGSLTGFGDVCRYILSQSSVKVDSGAWAAAAGYLNSFKCDTYVNDPDVSPWEWLDQNILPLVPVTVRRGPDGVYPIITDLRARSDRGVPVTEGPDFSRSGPVQVEGTIEDVRNLITLRYAPNGQKGSQSRTMTAGQNTDRGAEAFSTAHTRISQDIYGTTAEEAIDTNVVYQSGTAGRILSWMVRLRGRLPVSVDYEADWSWGWVQVGYMLALTDSDLQLTDQLCMVVEREMLEHGWRYRLLIDQDDPRDDRISG